MPTGLQKGLKSSMRAALVGASLFIVGCVSSSQTGINSADFDPEEAARTRMSLGLTYLQNNNYTQAKRNLDKAIEFDPRSADVQYAMAYYYQLVGENQRAEEYYIAALDIEPNNGDIANSFGAFKCQNSQYDEAKTYFLRAIDNRSYSNAAQTYENLALCAQSQNNIQDAIAYFENALKHQPARAKTLFLLSELYVATEQWQKAKSTLRRYERVAKVSPDSLWLAFEIAKGQKDDAAAKGYGDMLLSLFPNSTLAKRYLAERSNLDAKVIKTVKTVVKDSRNGNSVSANQSGSILRPTTKQTVLVVNSDEPSTDSAPAPDSESNSDERSKTVVQSAATELGADKMKAGDPAAQDADNENVAAKPDLSDQTSKFHVVKEAENLYRISLLYNIRMSTLQKWNNLDNTGAIIAGQKLWLVPPSMQEE
ncbi:MAG: type IV pilus biogenesis/stability protein PilW [Alteromonas sp.]|jgi:type IV pilus assembly protein PilF|uniref:type IV pilus biogenesis/stability protein PilW n=1 Tax=Alteromonas sp. TaxID=232 RepID=UPI0032D98A9B